MKNSWKAVGLVTVSVTIGALGAAGAVVAAGGFDNPTADSPPHIIKFAVNHSVHDGPGCGLQWDGTGTTATVKHGDPHKPGNKGCTAGKKIDKLAEAFPGGRSTWDVWVGEPSSDIALYGHGPFKGWATIVGTDTTPPDSYDFVLANTSHDGATIYLTYDQIPPTP
jgi:hypothetical protein